MDYTPTTWKNGDTITAEKLNKIENGISDLFDLGVSVSSWTPTVSGMASYSRRKGRYFRIGDVVIISFAFWGIMAGSTTEKITVSGIPFTPADDGYAGGGYLSGYHTTDDVVFSSWVASTDGNIYAYGQIAGTGNKWGQSGIYQKASGECGGGGTIMFKTNS